MEYRSNLLYALFNPSEFIITLVYDSSVIYRLKNDKDMNCNYHSFTCMSFQADELDRPPAAPVEGLEELTAAVLVPPHRVSFMWTAWVFFKSFFSSLIPEGPQGMAN